MKKILIIENQPVIVAGITAFILQEYPGAEILNVLSEKLRKDTIRSKYDCYILGINPIVSDNDSLIQNILIHQPDAQILIFANDSKTIFAKHYLKAGARGYISKFSTKTEFITSLRTLFDNKIYLSDEIKYALTTELVENKKPNKIESLSKRELEVTALLSKGMSNSEISNLMHLHTSSVGTYKARIFEKLHIKNVIELRQFAQMNNLLAS